MSSLKILLVEDDDKHVDLSLFPKDNEITRVKTLAEAVGQIYGLSKMGYTDRENPNPLNYQVLLTDMNFPIGYGRLGGNDISGLIGSYCDQIEKALPLGWPLVIMGAQVGIPKIGLLTDTNHHQGAMAASFDCVKKSTMILEESIVCFWDSRTQVWNKEGNKPIYGAIDGNGVKQYQNLLSYLINPQEGLIGF
jgi:hypothetical protein